MTASRPAPQATDPLAVLREYGALAPWSLRDLAALAGALLEASGVFPLNAAARARPSERTIRFYVAQGLVSPPEGRGTAAIYSYRHLLQVLAIKLRQMEGATLGAIVRDMSGQAGDVLERRVAAALGSGLPAPDRLNLSQAVGAPRGKVGRVVQAWMQPAPGGPARPSTVRRLPVGPGIELQVDDRHPLLRSTDESTLVETVRAALDHLSPEPDEG
ncbi:MAG: MerR family transcriptional regulator [Gemmatimonadales bacterium]